MREGTKLSVVVETGAKMLLLAVAVAAIESSAPRHFKDRRVWLVEPDAKPPTLLPYPADPQ